MKSLDRYIERCFIDAFASENRTYDRADWSYEYIIVNNSVLIPISRCKYGRVLHRAEYRIENNINKNFGLTVPDNGWLVEPDSDISYFDRNFIFCFAKVGNRLYEVDELCDANYQANPPYIDVLEFGRNCGMSEEEVRTLSFKDYKDLWIQTFGDFHPSLTITDKSSNVTVIQ